MSNSRRMPAQRSIYEYWHRLEGRKELERYSVALESQRDINGKVKIDCFACGVTSNIERCHIIAKSDGGSDDVGNLHLLCKPCHLESEMLSGIRYWHWLKHMIENVWSPFTEHIHERRVRLGFSEERLLEAYKIGGLEEALNYIAFFEANTQEESDDFKSKFRDALKQIQTKLDKRSRAEGEDVNG